MHSAKRSLLWLNILGGIAVLGSYAWGLVSSPMMRSDLWGGVPEVLRPIYTANMLLAAAGFFAFSYFVLFRLDPARTRVGGRFGFGAFHALYVLILAPSVLWMPLTSAMLEMPSWGLWVVIRVTLGLVGVGSLGLFVALLSVTAPGAAGARRLALIGSAAFCLQTAVLDAVVWPAFFPY